MPRTPRVPRLCQNCEFYESDENLTSLNDNADGMCRRYAPRSIYLYDGVPAQNHWPLVASDDWCGEYKEA